VIDHVTLLSPARIEGRVARDNFTPIVGRTISSFFNVFASGWVLRSAGLKGSGRVLWSYWPFTLTQQNLPETRITLFAPQNAATESGNAGTEIVLGERFPAGLMLGSPPKRNFVGGVPTVQELSALLYATRLIAIEFSNRRH